MFKTDLKIHSLVNHSFKMGSHFGERLEETFDKMRSPEDYSELCRKTFKSCVQLVPENMRPKSFEIILEDRATVKFADGETEEVGLGAYSSTQFPQQSAVRLNISELFDNQQAWISILGHEIGHMVFEWPCRQSGIVTEKDRIIPFWAKPIYEGTADFVAAVVGDAPLIGAKNFWSTRYLFDYESYEKADQAKMTDKISEIEAGFQKLAYLSQSRYQTTWLNQLKAAAAPELPHPFARGQWLACELWKIYKSGIAPEKITSSLIDIALTGEKFDQPVLFLEKFKNSI